MKKKLFLVSTLLAVFALADAQATLRVRELFDGLTPSLNGAGDSATSLGFEPGTTWVANLTDGIKVANNFNVDPGVTNQMPFRAAANGGIWWTPTEPRWGTGWWATRQLATEAQLNMAADGVYYITYNMRRRSDAGIGFGFASAGDPSAQFLSVGATWNTTSFNPPANRKLVVAQGTLNVGQGCYGANAYSTTEVANDERNLILIKITTSAAGNDTVQAAFFTPSRAGYGHLPPDEASVVWDVTYTYADNNLYTHLLAYVNGPTSSCELDAFRMGTTYSDVVQIQPVINTQPTPSPSATVYAGVPVSLTVTASGGYPAPMSYQWWKGGTQIPDATNATFTLTDPVVADSGDYYVVVANPYGSVTSITNTLTILPANPPVVVSDVSPAAPVRFIRGYVTFAAVIDGTPPFTFQWKHNGADVPGATGTSLRLTDLAPGAAGSYVLYVTNNFGWTNTAAATLTVRTPAPGSYEEMVVTNRPIAYWRLNEGAYLYDVPSVAFEYMGGNDAYHTNIYTIDGIRPPTFLGMEETNQAAQYNGNSASSTTVSLMNNLGQFTLMGWFNPSVWPQQTLAGSGRVALFGQNDAAEFGFHGTNIVGMWTPGGGFVSFNAATLISPFTWYFIVAIGDGSKITFYLNGNEAASFSQSTTNYGSSSYPFRIGYGVLDANANEFQGNIDEVALFDRALSVDDVNALYAKAVGVAQPPSILVEPVGDTRYVTRSKTFTVTAAGTLPLHYQWRHNGTPIPGATTNFLVLNNLTTADAGNYDVVITNVAGSTNSALVTLQVLVPAANSYEEKVVALDPVAYYRLNEAAGSPTAYDYWGGFNGAILDAAAVGVPGPVNPPFPGFGSVNTALAVSNGVANSWVSCPAFNLNTNTVTLSAWVYADGNQGGWRGILFCRAGNTVAGLHVGNGNELRYTWNNASDTWGWDSGLLIPVGEWCFVAAVIEPTKATLYVGTAGGFKSAVNPVTHPLEEFNGVTLIGRDSNDATGRIWNGLIDEVMICNRALSSAEVFSLFQRATPLQPRLALETANVVVADTKPAGTPFNGFNLGAAWVSSSTDLLNRTRTGVMEFTEANRSQIIVPPHAEFNTAKGAMCFWMRSDDYELNNGAMILDRRGSNGEILFLQNGQINWQPSWVYSSSTLATVNDGNWHHVAYVYDQSASPGYSQVYIDGALDSSYTNTTLWTWDLRQIEIGLSHDSYWDAYNGQLDDLRFYNRELSAAEVAQIFAGDSPLVGAADLVGRYNFDTSPLPGWQLVWNVGQLEAADAVDGPYQPVAGAASPLLLQMNESQKFYRTRLP